MGSHQLTETARAANIVNGTERVMWEDSWRNEGVSATSNCGPVTFGFGFLVISGLCAGVLFLTRFFLLERRKRKGGSDSRKIGKWREKLRRGEVLTSESELSSWTLCGHRRESFASVVYEWSDKVSLVVYVFQIFFETRKWNREWHEGIKIVLQAKHTIL